MTKYEVGKPFPHPDQKAPGQDAARVMFIGEFFDVLIYSTMPEADKKAVTQGPLRYGVYQKDDIPFFLVDFNGAISFDMPMNINKVDQAQVDTWLNAKANLVTLYLLDARTNILLGIRAIGLKSAVAEQIRDILEKQDEHYTSPSAVDEAIILIENELTTADMMKRTTMHRL